MVNTSDANSALSDDIKAAVDGSKNIVFLHPDLGIGGAERLVIDAAVGLQGLGHTVTILTSYCNPNHSFEETQDGTLDVRVRGDTLFPPSIGGRLSILFSILRQTSLLVSTGVFTSELRQLNPDVFIVDQLSAGIPLIRYLFPNARILFYGHFPDQLLLREFGDGFIRQVRILWRVPFDFIESWTTACADVIAVNSKFTRNIFRKTLPGLRTRDLKVIYPCVDTEDQTLQNRSASIWPEKRILLSINRFECKKDLALAIKAYAGLLPQDRSNSKLVLAGGFDPRNPENAECYDMIKNLTTELKLSHATYQPQDTALDNLASEEADVLFLLSISNDLKKQLLTSASLLIYTPTNEHFGIVPLEAMVASVPVLATNTGGPLETVYDGRTGWLRDPQKVDAWTEVMRKVLIPSNAEALAKMGAQGRQRVNMEFSRTNMTDAFNREIMHMCESDTPRPRIAPDWAYYTFITLVVVFLSALLAVLIVPPAAAHIHMPRLAKFVRRATSPLPAKEYARGPRGHAYL